MTTLHLLFDLLKSPDRVANGTEDSTLDVGLGNQH